MSLAANSSIKGQIDFEKFDKARKLDKHLEKIRHDYTKDLEDKFESVRQRGTAMYLIDTLSLRARNEKLLKKQILFRLLFYVTINNYISKAHIKTTKLSEQDEEDNTIIALGEIPMGIRR
nr:12290_t:CDS:2 [Entrophospora candida]